MRARGRLARHLQVLLLGAAAMLFCVACTQGDRVAVGAKAGKQANIVAGYGEKTFPEEYHLSITLPMPETEFLALLKRLKLYYQVCGERGTDNYIPEPRQVSKIDLSKAEKCYEFDGGHDAHVAKTYRAFVDKDHRVIYIENAFGYNGP